MSGLANGRWPNEPPAQAPAGGTLGVATGKGADVRRETPYGVMRDTGRFLGVGTGDGFTTEIRVRPFRASLRPGRPDGAARRAGADDVRRRGLGRRGARRQRRQRRGPGPSDGAVCRRSLRFPPARVARGRGAAPERGGLAVRFADFLPTARRGRDLLILHR